MSDSAPRALVIQHEEPTPPGFAGEWLAERGFAIDLLRIDEEERPAAAGDYRLLVSLGSEFAAFDDSLPWIRREMDIMQEALEEDVPILGLCFGGQLLARALGARCFRGETCEVGWITVETRDPHLVPAGPWFQWHFDTFTPPPGAEMVASTEMGPQAFTAGPHMGLQFHPEVTPAIMERWVEAYPHELQEVGVDPAALLAETRRRAEAAQTRSRLLLESYARLAGLPPAPAAADGGGE